MTAVAAKFPRRRDGYYHLNGEKYVSVTEVISVLNKPALVTWAAKTAATLVLNDPEQFDTAEKAASGIYQARDRAAGRGTTVHSLAEAVLLGGEIDETDMAPAILGRLNAIRTFVRDTQPKLIETECNVYSEKHLFAGTCDLIAEIGGQTLMVDWKTGKGIYPESALQLSAYRHADFILTKDPEPLRLPMPAISATAVCLLMDDGTYTFQRVEAPIEVFLALQRVWAWTKEGK